MPTIEQIKQAVANVAPKYGVTNVTLFGSYANGSQTPESDVDLLIEFVTTTHVTLLTLARIKNVLEERLGKSVDLIAEPIPAGSLLKIEDEVLLYENKG